MANWLHGELGFNASTTRGATVIREYGSNLSDGDPRYNAISVEFSYSESNGAGIRYVPSFGHTYESGPGAYQISQLLPQDSSTANPGDITTGTYDSSNGNATATYEYASFFDEFGDWETVGLSMGGCEVDVYDWAVSQTGAHDPFGAI